MTKVRILLFLLTLAVVGTVGSFIAFYARGYRFDTKLFKFQPNGILVIKSDPDGAQIFINGELKTATNASISIAPGTYDVSVQKEGYLTWQKRLEIKKEIVTEADAQLFRNVPSLSAITFSGVVSPLPSDDFTKIAYGVPFNNSSNGTKAGLWVMETVNLPLGFARDPRRITDGDLISASWQWSPDGREILLTTSKGIYLLDAGTFTPQNQNVNVASTVNDILAKWKEEEKQKLNAQLKPLPAELVDILERKTSAIVFSPDETKILYTASGSATIPDELIKVVPGASTQKQERTIQDGQTYVYDIKEDRNFVVDKGMNLILGNGNGANGTRRISWFPTSRQLVLAEEGKVIIMDLDGTNAQTVYSGSYVSPHAYPSLNKDRLLVLTNLGADSSDGNLYSLSVK